MIDNREANLPKWCQQLLADLRQRVSAATEPLIKELAAIRPACLKLRAENSALHALLEAAAKGGHLTSKAIMDVIAEYAPWENP